MEPARIFPIAALVAGVLTFVASIEPVVGKVQGAPIGLGIAAAGFAVAAALVRR